MYFELGQKKADVKFAFRLYFINKLNALVKPVQTSIIKTEFWLLKGRMFYLECFLPKGCFHQKTRNSCPDLPLLALHKLSNRQMTLYKFKQLERLRFRVVLLLFEKGYSVSVLFIITLGKLKWDPVKWNEVPSLFVQITLKSSLRGRLLKGKGKGVLGARETLLPRAPLGFLSCPKSLSPSLSNACHAGYRSN